MEAQKLTLDDIQSKIESATYLNPVGTLTIAILTLTNGYTVTGESSCVNTDDFDADVGKKIAYENAEEKVWMLEGYLRKEIAYRGSEPLAGQPVQMDTSASLSLDPPAPLPASGKTTESVSSAGQTTESVSSAGQTTESVSSAGQTTIAVDLPTVAVAPHDDMVPYLGVKIVNAKPMSRGVYIQLRGWDLPGDEDPADAGYLVEYTDQQRSNVTGFQGYVSWSPADVFMAAYSPLPAPAADTGNVQASSSLADPSNPAPVSGGDTAVVDNPAPPT
jgi:hypothetical protein